MVKKKGDYTRPTGVVWPKPPCFSLFNYHVYIFLTSLKYCPYYICNNFQLNILGHGQGMFDCAGGLYIDSMSNIFVVDRMNHSKLLI